MSLDMNDNFGPGGAYVQRLPRGWWSRNWKWFVPVTLLVGVLLCGGCCGGILTAVLGVIKSSEPYQMALKRVQADPQVIDRLGQPIEETGWFPMGNIEITGPGGEAQLQFSVAGPQGKAQVFTEAVRQAGQWEQRKLTVRLSSGETLVLQE